MVARAQVRHEIRAEAGVAHIEQPGTRARSAFVLSGLRHHGDSVMATLLSGAATWARDSVAAFQVAGALAWRPSPRSPWQFEGGASGAAFALQGGIEDGNGAAWARARRALPGGIGLMAGAGYGYTTRTRGDAHSASIEAGSSVALGALHLDVVASRTRTEDSLLMAASRVYVRDRSPILDLDDVAVGVSWTHGPFEVGGTTRFRQGIRGTSASQGATYWTATYAVSPRYAVVVGAGRLLADPIRGGPDATVMSASLRFSYAELTEAGPVLREGEATLAPIASGNVLTIRVRAPAGAKVEVAGSFSGWEPVPVTYRGDLWQAEVQLPPGRHRVAYRIGGGPWRAPANLGRLKEFGGEVGLIVVP